MNLSRLMVSVSGVRGEVGSTLTPEVIEKYTLAFGTFIKGGTVIVGRDSRVSGPFVSNIVKGCLVATGCRVIDIGIVPTPTVQMAIEHHKAAGGIAITASHNPAQWNGLKFMDHNARFLKPEDAEKVYAMGDNHDYVLQEWTNLGLEEIDDQANKRHNEEILKLSYIDTEKIRQKRFKVVLDCVNGAGGFIVPQLLEELGCEVKVINGEANGKFAHTPEPLPENLTQLKEAVIKEKADIGFAVDPDVDRCAIVDNTGTAIGEEYTLALAVKLVLSQKMGRVAVNMSTSRASEDIANYYNCMFVRSKVGEINVAVKMIEIEAIIGGEGNGGVILPELHLGRDAPLAVAMTLQYLAEFDGTMRELFLSLPQYKMVKEKVSIEGMDSDKVLATFAEKYKDEQINLLDGVKIDFDNMWVHLRKSNTEPIVRVMTEAPDEDQARALADRFMGEVKSLM
jgi:phosphomannomutase